MTRNVNALVVIAAVISLVVTAWVWNDRFRYDDAPAVSFTMLDGSRPALKDLDGNPVLVTFWGTSCVACIREMPILISLYEEFHARGLSIIGVAMPFEPPHLVYQFQQMRQLPYQIALDLDGSVSQGFGDVRLTPTTVLVSPQGKIVYRKTGPFDEQWLRQRIVGMLEASA